MGDVKIGFEINADRTARIEVNGSGSGVMAGMLTIIETMAEKDKRKTSDLLAEMLTIALFAEANAENGGCDGCSSCEDELFDVMMSKIFGTKEGR